MSYSLIAEVAAGQCSAEIAEKLSREVQFVDAAGSPQRCAHARVEDSPGFTAVLDATRRRQRSTRWHTISRALLGVAYPLIYRSSEERAWMRRFEKVIDLAVKRKGGAKAYETALAETRPLQHTEIAAVPDDRILAAMTRRVFYAGFSTKVVDAKWDAFETAFEKFAPDRCAWMTEERFDELLKEKNIVRNGAKIRSVQENAQFVSELTEQHGSAGRFFAEWPDSNYVGLLELLKKKASRLGGETGMRFLRSIGKPAFIPTSDVVKALIREGVLASAPSGKRDFQTMQAAFNQWSAQSGLDLTYISWTLAFSVD